MGKFLAMFIMLTALIGGGSMYWLQVYGLYDEVAVSGSADVQMTLLVTGEPEPILYEQFQAIDSDSSPIRYRACFTTNMSSGLLTETYELYENAVPLTGPKWFDCYDAREIGLAIENGEALSFMGTKDVVYGVDRVVSILPDGRGFVWHQINECGEIAFDGKRVPEHCAQPPSEVSSE